MGKLTFLQVYYNRFFDKTLLTEIKKIVEKKEVLLNYVESTCRLFKHLC